RSLPRTAALQRIRHSHPLLPDDASARRRLDDAAHSPLRGAAHRRAGALLQIAAEDVAGTPAGGDREAGVPAEGVHARRRSAAARVEAARRAALLRAPIWLFVEPAQFRDAGDSSPSARLRMTLGAAASIGPRLT